MKKPLRLIVLVALIMSFLLLMTACEQGGEEDTFGLTVREQLELARAAESDGETFAEISDEVQAETAESEEVTIDAGEADSEAEDNMETTEVVTTAEETTVETTEVVTTAEETTVETTEVVITAEETTAVTSATVTEKVTEAVTMLPQATITYVLNTNSKKFHDPGCASVKKMKEKNRSDFTGTRAEAIAMGYEPCGSCKP